ncbi:glycosyltransferase family 1 protein, partial [Candidatus Poribacteria bacterium]|nr:glycosyltransferase family 1 protein [Candidatus Poribacteria bacterium]
MIPILYLSHCGSSIGGGEKQLAYLVTNIDRTRYHPLVVCPDDGVFAEHLRRTG